MFQTLLKSLYGDLIINLIQTGQKRLHDPIAILTFVFLFNFQLAFLKDQLIELNFLKYYIMRVHHVPDHE
jgi:hypothetical protein